MMSGKMYRFRVPEHLMDPRYIAMYLQTSAAHADIDMMKTGISDSGLNLTHDRFRQLPVPIAPYVEQQRIVAAIEEEFSRIDAGVAALENVSNRLIKMRRAVVAGLMNSSARREPLGALLSEPLRNGHSAKASGSGAGIRTLTLSAVTQGDFGLHNTKITVADPARVAALWLRSGDILIERSNTPELVGTARVYLGPDDFAIYPDLMIRARLNERMRPRFAELLLQSGPIREYFRGRAQGISGTMPKIDQQTISEVELPVPGISEQDELIAATDLTLTALANVGRAADKARRRAGALKSAVLSAAFSGQLVPQDTSEEAASALLERIAAFRASATDGTRPVREAAGSRRTDAEGMLTGSQTGSERGDNMRRSERR
jgi:type I restriction enzyme S subunit